MTILEIFNNRHKYLYNTNFFIYDWPDLKYYWDGFEEIIEDDWKFVKEEGYVFTFSYINEYLYRFKLKPEWEFKEKLKNL